MIKSKPCKECGSIYHTKMYHKPRKPIKRTAIKKTVAKKKIKRVSRGQLVKQLDNVFSQYIRLRDAVDVLGELSATCVTCGDTKPWKQMQNGHYESRGHYPTRWSEDNCHVQCVACNVFRKGNYTNYARFMIDKYGADKLEELHIKATTNAKISTPEIREMIDKYKTKVKEIL